MEEIVEEIFQDLSYNISHLMEKYGFIRESFDTDEIQKIQLVFENEDFGIKIKFVIYREEKSFKD